MKIRMAENSLFAILLRKPWWLSLGIALALALLARALLPANFVVVGAFGAAFPFVVIAAIAAWKQARAPSAAQVEAALQRLRGMGSVELLDAAAAAWRAEGYAVECFTGAGADLKLERRGPPVLVGLRRWKAASTGVEPLRELHAAMQRADDALGWYVAGGEVSDKARDFARAQSIRLIGAQELALLVARAGR